MNQKQNDNNDYKNYQKKGFFRRLPFGVKATFIKYWFYGAVYFFCFMGLGLVINSSENLVIATGLIGGVIFDIALYNIYLLIAETREEASKWWVYKSKRFYSVFINVVILMALFFAFVYLVRAIKSSMPGKAEWLFQEPLSAALLLTILDTALVWIKNGSIVLFKKIFKKDTLNVVKEDYIKVLDVTPVSVSIEVNNKDIYYASKPYNVLLDNEIVLKKVNSNVVTLFDLKPDTQYRITINKQSVVFTTPKIYKFYKVYENNDLQKVIDMADQYSLIVVNAGTYKIKSLSLKSNLTLYLRKGVTLLTSNKEDDYPIIPPYTSKDEVYGNYKGEPQKMRQSIIHLDHIKNVRIVGEGLIDANALASLYKNQKNAIAPPHLIFINHCSNVSVVGLKLKDSPQWTIHPFFSNDVNLINLEINNSKDSIITDGVTPQCSENINIIGCHFANLKKGVAIKAGKNELASKYQTPSKNITIRNCFMEHSNHAVCLGSEGSAGIHSVKISYSYFVSTTKGVVVNTKRGSGKDAVVKDINVSNIKMDGVLTPIVMNMFYSVNPKKENKRTLTKEFIPIDNETPYLNNFTFKNIEAKNFEYTCGYFYGLPEKYIYEINIIDSTFIAKDICSEGVPIDIEGIDKCTKQGFIAKNVRTINLKNVKLENISGKRINLDNVSELTDN